jgi:hypothetical protein
MQYRKVPAVEITPKILPKLVSSLQPWPEFACTPNHLSTSGGKGMVEYPTLYQVTAASPQPSF